MAIRAAVAAPRGLRRLFSITTNSIPSFNPPPATAAAPARETAEPNTNLFVSGVFSFLFLLASQFLL
ncbi:hypothetical protein L6164_018549 [Bauhinia variegata]|uniref:Uncharacterized protein n=1 Tax=Bauhinia variegata TaxID=167791 RepID=A0ACB9NC28_BAUVA|nr:hypothetical protein L6164_018549 [Bauhinia variegata]